MASQDVDVLVIGAGIAGVSAAIEAARAGVRVGLASMGTIFSGSSFYGGTWGLGLVGPQDCADEDDFAQTIAEVGRGMADPTLVRTLVAGINPAVRWLEELGVELRRPADETQVAYIPCFDHAHRSWHGLVRASLRDAWTRELDRLGVARLPKHELVDLCVRDGSVAGAELYDHRGGVFLRVPCAAVVLATGGLAGLYEHRLTGTDDNGAATGVALEHGCRLVNAEFLQMMPATLAPARGIVLNEKAFRYATIDLPQALLEQRSGYGPFTSRLASCAVDQAIMAAGPEGLELSYHLPPDAPELVSSYFDWLGTSHGIRPEDRIRTTLFAHASNGGILINRDAACVGGPGGLYACGECAGGMHGADRIGGLASAAALVFGRIAGRSAAARCNEWQMAPFDEPTRWMSPEADDVARELRRCMRASAMVGRTEDGLEAARQQVCALERQLRDASEPTRQPTASVASLRTQRQLAVAKTMLRAMQLRRESRGSHHRADHEGEDPRAGVPRVLALDGGTVSEVQPDRYAL